MKVGVLTPMQMAHILFLLVVATAGHAPPVARAADLARPGKAIASPARLPVASVTPAMQASSSREPSSVRKGRTILPGMLASIDPQTGRLGAPTAEQMARLTGGAHELATTPRPQPVLHANGATSLDVRGWMRDYAVARISPTGRARLGCADSRRPAIRSARAIAGTPSVREER